MAINYIQNALFSWYELNKRDLPWRGINNPYKIWLSEVILQQTKVNQGLNYYLKFVKAFPTVDKLALADESVVLKLWQGLGYYSRARNLHNAAKQIHKMGEFPNTYNELLKLKGVGEYTAAAISSFAYNEPKAVVDGNVYRVLSRLFGVFTPIDSPAGKKEFQNIANSILPKQLAGDWNQAIMEFGALQCTPKSPNCTFCPLIGLCEAHKKNKVSELPFKKRKTKKQTRFIYYVFIKSFGNTVVVKRPENGIWGNLYEFPNVVTKEKINTELALKNMLDMFSIDEGCVKVNSIQESIKHILSHRIFYCTFIEIEVTSLLIPDNFVSTSIQELNSFPVSRLMEKYLNEC